MRERERVLFKYIYIQNKSSKLWDIYLYLIWMKWLFQIWCGRPLRVLSTVAIDQMPIDTMWGGLSSSCRWESCWSGSWQGELWALSSAFDTIQPLIAKFTATVFMVLHQCSATLHKTHCWPMNLLLIIMCSDRLYQTAEIHDHKTCV